MDGQISIQHFSFAQNWRDMKTYILDFQLNQPLEQNLELKEELEIFGARKSNNCCFEILYEFGSSKEFECHFKKFLREGENVRVRVLF